MLKKDNSPVSGFINMMIWMSLMSILLQLPAVIKSAETKCVQNEKDSVRFGGMAQFYFCKSPPVHLQVPLALTVDPMRAMMLVYENKTREGWSWHRAGSVEDGYYYNISLTPDSCDDFTTTELRLSITKPKPGGGVDVDFPIENVTLLHAGPPEACEKWMRETPKKRHSPTSPLGTDSESAMFVVSQSPVVATVDWHAPCNDSDGTGTPSFSASSKQDASNPAVYKVMFKVTKMSKADLGVWHVSISNMNGSSTVDVEVKYMYSSGCKGYDFPSSAPKAESKSGSSHDTTSLVANVCLIAAVFLMK